MRAIAAPGGTLRLLAALFTVLLAACFEVRPLDRQFDAAPDPTADGAIAPDVGPGCRGPDDSCDGRDDDCDGQADEDWAGEATCGVGVCAAGAIAARCVSGFVIDCQPGAPAEEACNAVDDDCDGRVDEDVVVPCGRDEGLCEPGARRCVDGALTACDAVGPADETCDGRDEDCDGRTDEELTRPCAGDDPCAAVEQCIDGAWQGCGGPVDEICNGRDDDCDGLTDEVGPRPCGVDVGACVSGVERCVDGAWTPCEGAVAPAAEDLCDGRDDDCDGAVDEGPDPCGACGLAARVLCPIDDDGCDGDRNEVVCLQPLATVQGAPGDHLGRRLTTLPDLDGDGWPDVVGLGDAVVMTHAGGDGDLRWREDGFGAVGPALVPFAIGLQGDPVVIVGLPDDGPGTLLVLASDGDVEEVIETPDDLRYGVSMAGLDAQRLLVVGDLDQDVLRLLRFDGRQDGEVIDDRGVGEGLGAAMAIDAEAEQLLVTQGEPGETRVVAHPLDAEGFGDPRQVLPPGPGVGARLAVGQWRRGGAIMLAATVADLPLLDLVRTTGLNSRRYALDGPGRSLAMTPASDRPGERGVVVGLDGAAQIILRQNDRIGQTITVQGPPAEGFGAAVTIAEGPDRSWLVAIGAPDAADGAGRIYLYRLE